MDRCSKTQRPKGFTLVELVIVVLIIGILAAAAAPKFVSSLHRMRTEQAAKRIKADLGYARQTAVKTSRTVTVTFDVASNSYSIPSLAALDRTEQAYAIALSDTPYNATLAAAVLGSDSNVEFDRYGRPDSGGTITVESGGHQETVTIEPETGRASIP